ncbi:DegT/DnrJ/EryC1/StrS family aminotransferase [Dyadobacter crusticola]|uniref:DegT/DnrJ/EryC1/StrS family aminotransferase n=1 Tax=Dyadobacter crusticola TaxID=292407 RepID=UPI0004E1B7BA|nr:DegT/DnrJ/EryC1/StrS family aminotransferase [Dyadobacter crusticola]
MDYKIWLSPPHLGGNELKYIQDAFESNWIAPVGPNIDALQRDLCLFTGSKYALAVSSGTAAIHLALQVLGVQRDDIVLCQSLTFVASANPILYLQAVPVFIDSEAETWNMCPEALETAIRHYIRLGKKPKAVMLVHLYGMPAKLKEIIMICSRYDIPLIEDAAEALGSSYQRHSLGTLGYMGVFSFNGNKIITTSGGGALLCQRLDYMQKARFLASQAKDYAPHYEHSEIGYNYLMSNICAGIGRGQMEVLEARVEKRRFNFELYKNQLMNIPGISFQKEPAGAFSNRWLTTIVFDPKTSGILPQALRTMFEEQRTETRPVWKPMHLQPLFKDAEYFGGDVAQRIFSAGICLPSGSTLDKQDINNICECIIKAGKN